MASWHPAARFWDGFCSVASAAEALLSSVSIFMSGVLGSIVCLLCTCKYCHAMCMRRLLCTICMYANLKS